MPSRSLSTGALLVLMLAGQARAALSPPGMNIRWDHCYADGGTANRVFACDTNSGVEFLVMSFELTGEMPLVTGLEFNIAIASASPTLPAWWQFKNSGTCRQASLNYTGAELPIGVNCSDWSNGTAAAGIGRYLIGNTGPNTVLLQGVAAVPAPMDLLPGNEYTLGTLSISHAKTVGTGACGGCSTPVCIVFSDLKVATPNPADDVRLINGANYLGSVIASWQNSYIAAMFPPGHNSVGIFFPAQITQCVPYSTTANRSSTWGQVKALYR